jgi:hypothetical protein
LHTVALLEVLALAVQVVHLLEEEKVAAAAARLLQLLLLLLLPALVEAGLLGVMLPAAVLVLLTGLTNQR